MLSEVELTQCGPKPTSIIILLDSPVTKTRRQTKALLSSMTVQVPGDHFPVAEGKGKTSFWERVILHCTAPHCPPNIQTSVSWSFLRERLSFPSDWAVLLFYTTFFSFIVFHTIFRQWLEQVSLNICLSRCIIYPMKPGPKPALGTSTWLAFSTVLCSYNDLRNK